MVISSITLLASLRFQEAKMNTHDLVKRLTRNALLLALFCVIGMFSIPLGDHLKVSLQLWMVFMICFLAEGLVDALIVISSYVLIGLFLPIYAGFAVGITPTFGFVLGFIIAAPAIYLLYRYLPLKFIVRMTLAGFAGILIVYISGTIFMCLYLSWSVGTTLVVAVLPYIPFDLIKLGFAGFLMFSLPRIILPAHLLDRPNWPRKRS